MISGVLVPFSAFITAALIALKAIPAIITVSRLKGLTDIPDSDRKIHKNHVPNLGGVGLYGGFIISYNIWIGSFLPAYLPALLAATAILFFTGIKDDVLVISPLKKLAGQIAAATIIVLLGDIQIPGLDGLFGVNSFMFYSGEVFSIFAIIIIINAYNLIDGIDGLAGMISILGIIVFGIWFAIGGHHAETVLCFTLAGSLAGFIYYNFEPARIFLGDTGSQITGLIMAVAAFRLAQLNPVTTGLPLYAPSIFIFSVMIIPMFDTLQVIIKRLSKGKSLFEADKNHIHHLLLDLGMRHYQAVILLTLFNMVIVICSFLISSWNVYIYIATVLTMALLILPGIRGLKFIKTRICNYDKDNVLNNGINYLDELFDDNVNGNGAEDKNRGKRVFEREDYIGSRRN
jgi:UDP-GlcNAc:undecaprenyl-phosphate/decaprenyl-phosphate GlcNAc-1-phosphate transferase